MDAWRSTALDIEECLESDEDDHGHSFVTNVVKSLDTVDRNILHCVLSRLGLPGWFRHVYFAFHSHDLVLALTVRIQNVLEGSENLLCTLQTP